MPLKNVLIFCLILCCLGACTTVSLPGVKRVSGYALQDTGHTLLARRYQPAINAHPGQSGFALMGSGLDAFAARAALFQLAEKSIDVQYYLVRDDLTGYLFFRSLVQAAERGVRVRVLLDDLSHARQTRMLAALDQHPNIEIRFFNPLQRDKPRWLQLVFRFEQFNRRMHNKSVTIDNRVSILGSRNIGNEYTEIASGLIYSGMEVLAVGPLATDVSAAFDQYWNYSGTKGIRQLSRPGATYHYTGSRFHHAPETQRLNAVLQTSPFIRQVREGSLPLHWARAELIVDAPEKIERPLHNDGLFLNSTGLRPYIENTRQRLLIITPYLIPRAEGLQFFRQLRQRGIEVSILTNSYAATDVKTVHAHYNRYRKPLLEMGVELFEFKSVRASISLLQRARNIIALADRGGKAGLHAKLINFDQSALYVGSMNIDPRSLYTNTELGVVITSPEISGQVLHWFDQNLNQLAYHLALHNGEVVWRDFAANGKGRLLTQEPDTSPLDRVFMHLMGLLPIEDHL